MQRAKLLEDKTANRLYEGHSHIFTITPKLCPEVGNHILYTWALTEPDDLQIYSQLTAA